MRRKILKVLDEVRPYLHADGGDVEFIDCIDGVVSLKLIGACSDCTSSNITLKDGIERRLKEVLPDIRYVRAV